MVIIMMMMVLNISQRIQHKERSVVATGLERIFFDIEWKKRGNQSKAK